jgi:Tfp pilus assembly protein PilN
VKAVNLIPADARRRTGAGLSAGTYGLFGVLLVILVGVSALVLTSNKISERKSDLAEAQQRSAVVGTQASALQPYIDFASLKDSRVQTVSSLAGSRFDWEKAMSGLSRVTTKDIWLTSMTGTVAPGVNVEGGSAGGAASLRSAIASPAVELAGCGKSNDAVVHYLSRLRALKGVTRVSLADAQKADAAGSSAASSTTTAGAEGASSDSCGGGSNTPAFDAVVFFSPMDSSATASAGTASVSTAGTTATPTAPTTTSTTPTTGATP